MIKMKWIGKAQAAEHESSDNNNTIPAVALDAQKSWKIEYKYYLRA